MALVLRNIFTWLYNTHNYHGKEMWIIFSFLQFMKCHIFHLTDPQLDDYPIINYAFFGIIISVIYLKLVTSILPAFMKNREPFNLKPFILAYNAFQVLFNGLLLIKVKHTHNNLAHWSPDVLTFCDMFFPLLFRSGTTNRDRFRIYTISMFWQWHPWISSHHHFVFIQQIGGLHWNSCICAPKEKRPSVGIASHTPCVYTHVCTLRNILGAT